MKLSKFDLDKKMSIAEMKQIKAGSVSSSTGGKVTTTDCGKDTESDICIFGNGLS